MIDDINIKVIIIGTSGTGKTNIIRAATNTPFEEDNHSTLTSSFVSKNIIIEKKTYHIELWDTAGQEKFKSLTKIFIVDSKIVIFVYDITQKKSFEELDYWVKLTKEALGEYPVYALFGNKKDLYLEEEVDEEEGKKKAEEIGAYFRLTSAKTERENLNEYITELVKMFINKNKNNDNSETYHREESFTLQFTKKKKKKEGCCEKS
jgi:small GTP-binding protein